MIKVIVTGGTGFIGNNLIPLFIEKPVEFYILSNDDRRSDYENVKYLKCNLLNQEEVNEHLRQIKASHLMHLAWGISPSNYNMPENFEWIKSSIGLLECFKSNGGQRALMAGTGVEYDWNFSNCIEGVTPTSNESLYGASKNILRQYAFKYAKEFGLDLVWPRLFFLYGPYEHPTRLFSHIITALLQNKNVTINNGSIFRDYMFVKDTSRMLLELLLSSFNGVVNISSGIPVNLGQIGEMISEIIGKKGLLRIEYPKVDSKKIVFANTTVMGELGLSPTYSISEGIKQTIDWWKKEIDG